MKQQTISTKTETNRWGWVLTGTVTELADGTFKATNTETTPAGTRTRESIFTMMGGVPRWASNGRVMPEDCIESLGLGESPLFDANATLARRHHEDAEAIAAYKARQANTAPSAEQMFEMRAAFGTGVTVVDVISGRRVAL